LFSQFPGRSYQLAELDGTLLNQRAVAINVKRLYSRGTTSFDETVGSEKDDVDVAEDVVEEMEADGSGEVEDQPLWQSD